MYFEFALFEKRKKGHQRALRCAFSEERENLNGPGRESQEATDTGVRPFRVKDNECLFLMNSVYLNLGSQCDSAFLCVHIGGEGDQQIVSSLR